MRIWSIHPKYLDQKGLVALWREALLAKNVLLKKTKGYTNHPQLIRFKNSKNPNLSINTYLHYIYKESLERGYHFDCQKIGDIDESIEIQITNKQIEYEFKHLLKKLKVRDIKKYEIVKKEKVLKTHPIFKIKKGEIENWEKLKNN